MKTNGKNLQRDTGVPPVRAMWNVIVLCLLLAAVGNRPAAAGEWRNSLKPKGTSAAPFTLVRDGKPACTIVIPAKPIGPEQKAADDLRAWVKQMSDAELAVSLKDVAGPSVKIRTQRDAPPDQYTIAAEGGNLLLSGGPGRGVINAVYALLEEDMGCRFYTNDSIRLPAGPTVTVAPVPRTYAPKLRLRDPFYAASFDPTWSLRNRTSAPDAKVPEEHGGRMDYGGLFVHTHAAL